MFANQKAKLLIISMQPELILDAEKENEKQVSFP